MTRSYRVLGPLEVWHGESRVDLGPPKQRAVLGALLCSRGAVVSVERLIDTVWPDDPPEAATTSLQAYISNLRRLLRGRAGTPSAIERIGAGYRLDVGEADTLDLTDFLRLARDARAAREDGKWEQALTAAEAAGGLWRAELLGGEFDELGWLGAEASALAETAAAVGEIHASALLAVGRASEALTEIVAARAADPFRERTVWLHMVALYRTGRVAEALDVFTAYQRRLGDELGLDPGTELVDLHGAILRQDPVIAAWPRSPHWSGAAAVDSPVDAPPVTAGPASVQPGPVLVGRAGEVARLRGALTDPATHWALLTGPAGIGKTRLAQEAAAVATEVGHAVRWVRCPDAEGTPAWWPLRQLCRDLGADPDEVLAVPPGTGADAARFGVYERVQRLLVASAADQPLTVIVDDAQWADAMTLGLLTYLVTMLRDAGVSLVVTIRDGEGGVDVDRLREAIAREGGLVLAVPRLRRAEVASLVRNVADAELDASSLDALVRRTEGNPLFVSEFARLPADQQRTDMLPDAIRSVLDRRLGSLDPSVLEVLSHAAVLGEEIDPILLAAVCERPVDQVADCLDEAVDERILVVDPGGRTRFAHALLRDQAAATIRPLRRCRIHLKVADELAGANATDAKARRAAHLLDALPVAEVATVVAACRDAAEDALAHWDSENAARWLAAALRTQEAVEPQAPEADDLLTGMLAAQARAGQLEEVLSTVEERMNAAVRSGRTATAGRLAHALIRAGGAWPWIGPHVENEGLRSALAEAAQTLVHDRPSLARVLAAAAIGECYDRDGDVARTLLARAAEVAQELDDDAVTADVTLAHVITYSGVAPHARASLEWARRMRELDYPDRAVDMVIVDTATTMATMLLGDIAATEELTRRAISGSERLRLPILRAQLRWMQASLAVWHGGFEVAKEHFRTAVAVHEDTQLYVAGSGALAMMALATEQGVLGEFIDTGGMAPIEWARVLLEQFTDNQVMIMLAAGVAALAGTEGDRDLATTMTARWLADDRAMIWTSLGNAVLLAGVVAQLELREFVSPLRAYLIEFRDCIAVTGHVGCVGPVALALAELAALDGDIAAADELLDRAIAIAERGGGAPSLLRSRLLRARLHSDAPDRAAELADIEVRARALGIESLAEQAHELAAG